MSSKYLLHDHISNGGKIQMANLVNSHLVNLNDLRIPSEILTHL
jgi:hypothetical protein